LQPSTKYYIRSYVSNNKGVQYGEQYEINFGGTQGETVTDYDGNVYHTITIGSQTWMVENLRTTRYRNGDLITGQFTYNFDETKVPVYGRLYLWDSVEDSRGIAPTGWHVATKSEFSTLQKYLEDNGYKYPSRINYGTYSNVVSKSMASKTLWTASSNEGTPGCVAVRNNASGFNAIPAGIVDRDFFTSSYINSSAYFWTANENDIYNAWYAIIFNSTPELKLNSCDKYYSFSVRCVKDTPATRSAVIKKSNNLPLRKSSQGKALVMP
jgi:uncharacterized protein (TIGR02145 family)